MQALIDQKSNSSLSLNTAEEELVTIILAIGKSLNPAIGKSLNHWEVRL